VNFVTLSSRSRRTASLAGFFDLSHVLLLWLALFSFVALCGLAIWVLFAL
jgi:hypothetical protein